MRSTAMVARRHPHLPQPRCQVLILQSDGSNWYVLGQPALAVASTSAGTWQAEIGEIVVVGNTTVTLPTPSLGAEVGVFAGSTSTGVVITAGASNSIYGDWLPGVEVIDLTAGRHVLLRGLSGNQWLIVAGEPKRTNLWSVEVEKSMGTEYTPSTTREVVVSLTWEAEHGAAYKLFVEGSRIGEWTGPSAAGTHTGIGHCFPVAPDSTGS